MHGRNRFANLALLFTLILGASSTSQAADEAAPTISLAEGKLALQAPAGWAKKEPKFAGIVLYEFAAPKAEGDDADARVTVGPAGGGVEANQQRWIAQFSQPDNAQTENRAKPTQKKVAGCEVHRLDVTGTYQAPRFAPGAPLTKSPGYRMLAVIIEVPDKGSYYVRMYGPEKTVEKHAADFEKMIDAMAVK